MLRSLLGVAVMMIGCADPFVLDATAAEVCQHLPDQRFRVPPALRELPPEMWQGIELERTFEFDLSGMEEAMLVDGRFELTSVRLTVVNPTDDLGFIEQAQLQLQPNPESGLEARQFNYVRTENTPRFVEWRGQAFEVAKYLELGILRYSVSMMGTLPPGDVLVNLDACAEVNVKIDY